MNTAHPQQKISNLLKTNSLQEADSELQQIMADLGFNKFSYNNYHKDFTQTEIVTHSLCTEQSQHWQEHYRTRKYEQIDPIHNHMRKSHIPISWKLENELPKYGKNQKQLFLEAMDFGLQGGFAVPIHSGQGQFANLVVQDIAILNHIQRHPDIEYTLHLIAHYYHARVRCFLAETTTTHAQLFLTTREIECLTLTSEYKTAKEIARILNITPRTVSFHLENTLKKLGAANKHQAVILATQQGLLR